jgi:hypothetical protein
MAEENVEFVEIDNVEEFSTLDELSPKFIKSPKVGEKIEFVIKGFKIVKDVSELEFSFEKNGKQKTASNALSNVDYGVKIVTMKGEVYWVNSWSVFGQLKAIAKKLGTNTMSGMEIQIDHVANGMLEENRDNAWIVKTKINGSWKALNKDTNEWN